MPAIVKRDIPERTVKQVSGLINLKAVFESRLPVIFGSFRSISFISANLRVICT